jgi:hypothetical protein
MANMSIRGDEQNGCPCGRLAAGGGSKDFAGGRSLGAPVGNEPSHQAIERGSRDFTGNGALCFSRMRDGRSSCSNPVPLTPEGKRKGASFVRSGGIKHKDSSAIASTVRNFLFEPARPRVTGRRGMVGVQIASDRGTMRAMKIEDRRMEIGTSNARAPRFAMATDEFTCRCLLLIVRDQQIRPHSTPVWAAA